jgi:hypothetical protein
MVDEANAADKNDVISYCCKANLSFASFNNTTTII